MTGWFLFLKWKVNLPRVYRCCMFRPYTEIPLLEVLVRVPCEERPMHNLPHLYAVPFITRYSMLLTQFGKKMDEEDCMPPSLSNSTNHVDNAAVVTFWFISMSLFFRKVHTVYIPAWWRQQIFVILIFLTLKRGATNLQYCIEREIVLGCVPAQFLRFSWSLALAMEKLTVYTWCCNL